MTQQPGEMLAGKFRIEAVIGHGAFGQVYRARDVMLDRLVAVKELDRGESDFGSTVYGDHVRRFQREAKIQARLNHPNVVHVYDLIEPAPAILNLVMEYVDGGSLKELLERRGALPADEALSLARQVLAGLAAVHADPRDIVHRDIKPSNVLLTRDGQAKLSDFGLAQIGDESARSGSGQPHPGTALYMSPEQETSNAYLQPASDLFSFGCVLFEMLTGVAYKSALRRKQDLHSLRPGVPHWLEEVVCRTLARDPDERPASAEALAAVLQDGARLAQEQAKQAALAEEQRRQEEARGREAQAAREAEARAAAEHAQQAAEAKARAEAEQQRQDDENRRRETQARAAREADAERARQAGAASSRGESAARGGAEAAGGREPAPRGTSQSGAGGG